ncbi:LytTR family transcriptional regulator DNA-binding domain-containing protein [Paenibacillus larvae]|uniref:LytTR family transcriptional regulator DNA-binding domain-containing protein n=1 Tax=Paenibacillus larvae TaxID=1464 RepID=UPI002280D44F|nr:LytTR family transcriptional regulator DNA-binding domain-containing protein [Paenibacillus larvae]MCY9512248.1 LytTR family transcriptional regulator DNA-binding domain-containing protein [Paenibacillus larvae]MCY9524451.1 LytTR family transcriptional regulator DNA-binding domain-containing protein [Paenibacillus larvae]
MHTKILGVRVVGDNITGDIVFFTIEDVYYVDLFTPKKNYRVPRFHTSKGVFTVLLTLDSCKKAFRENLVQLDSGNLVNISKIRFVKETVFSLTAHFDNGVTANISRNKRKKVAHLIKP